MRTLGEVAHFVRNIDLITELKNKKQESMYITPLAVLEMKQGREMDKALLMYCMMRACKYETQEELVDAVNARV